MAQKDPHKDLFSPPTTLLLTHSNPATLISLFLTHAKHPPTSGPLHRPIPLPGLFFLQTCPWPIPLTPLGFCAKANEAFQALFKIPTGTPLFPLLFIDIPMVPITF